MRDSARSRVSPWSRPRLTTLCTALALSAAATLLSRGDLRAQAEFPAALKEEVLEAADDANLDEFLQKLNAAGKELKANDTKLLQFVDAIIDSLDPEIVDQPRGSNYLEVVARYLAGFGAWPSSNPREATDLLGGLAEKLRNAPDNKSRQLALIVDNAIANAPNMYISLLRRYTPSFLEMRELVDDKLVPLLDVKYVQNSVHAHYIRSMIAAKYAELALFDAKMDVALCSGAIPDPSLMNLSSAYAQDLLDAIVEGSVPAAILKLRNDTLYQLALNAVTLCEGTVAQQHLGQIIGQQGEGSAFRVGALPDQIYVFRHLRTRRYTKEKEETVRTEGGLTKVRRRIPLQDDVRRKFYNPGQLALYLCRTAIEQDELSIGSLKDSLDAFENLDFWVELYAPEPELGDDPNRQLDWSREKLKERTDEIAEAVHSLMPGDFGQSATAIVLRGEDGQTNASCGAIRDLPHEVSVEDFLTDDPLWLDDSRVLVGGLFASLEAGALAEAIRSAFPQWIVSIGRPDITE